MTDSDRNRKRMEKDGAHNPQQEKGAKSKQSHNTISHLFKLPRYVLPRMKRGV
jgi:hypothetical protein